MAKSKVRATIKKVKATLKAKVKAKVLSRAASKKSKALQASPKATIKASPKAKTQNKAPSNVSTLKSGKAKPAAKAVAKTVATKPAAKAAAKSPLQTKPAVKSFIPASKAKTSKIDFSQFVTPLENRVFVEVDAKREKVTPGGLYIPDTVTFSEGYFEGNVLSRGPGKRNKHGQLMAMDVKKGDRVLFSNYEGTPLDIESRQFYFLTEEQILGVLK